MKKFISIVLVLTLALCLCACGNNGGEVSTDTSATSSQTENVSSTASQSESQNSSSSEIASSKVTSVDSSSKVISSTATSSKPTTSSKPAHTHSYSNATCTTPKKCSCGKTEGTALGHKWAAATCTAPKTCSVCKTTDGAALGHRWQNATCTSPKKCSCGKTEGAALGHKWTAATCTAPKTCSVCKTTEGAALGHKWQEATCTQAKKCTRCSATSGTPIGHNFENGVCKKCNTSDPDYVQYTIMYNANGGWGETESSSHLYNESRALSKNGFKKAGYTFAGWSINKNATSPQYTNTQSVKNLTKTNGATVTLYAVWKEAQTYLFSDLMPLPDSEESIYFNETAIDNTGKTHKNVAVLAFGGGVNSWAERFVSGQFSKIKGTIIPVSSELLDADSRTVIKIYGDGELIYESSEFNKYSASEKFEVNISGINTIRISIVDRRKWFRSGELMIEGLTLVR